MFTNGSAGNIPLMLTELGVIFLALALLARLASKLVISPIPFYLLAGLGLGNGGILPLELSESFIHIGAEIGVILLLFSMGLEYTSERLVDDLYHALPLGVADLIINFVPGVLAGLIFGWGILAALLLGGVVYISSSGIIAKLLTDLKRMHNCETPVIMSILVLEDVAMIAFLPIMTILLIGQGVLSGMVSVLVATVAGVTLFLLATRCGGRLSRLIAHPSNEIILLTTLGLTLLIAGLTEWVNLSAAVGAFLVGITLCKPVAKQVHRLIGPLRDLFAAVFFLFFGMGIHSGSLTGMALPAIGLGLLTSVSKILTGWWTTKHLNLDPPSRLRVGTTLIARGEFSLVIAAIGVGVGLEPELGPLAAAYVLFTAIFGPLLMRVTETVGVRVLHLAPSPVVESAEAAPEEAPPVCPLPDPSRSRLIHWPKSLHWPRLH
jgi:monovalent cation:H+ antiporter-2, CPA2 family